MTFWKLAANKSVAQMVGLFADLTAFPDLSPRALDTWGLRGGPPRGSLASAAP